MNNIYLILFSDINFDSVQLSSSTISSKLSIQKELSEHDDNDSSVPISKNSTTITKVNFVSPEKGIFKAITLQ